jgi:hypothetical protein
MWKQLSSKRRDTPGLRKVALLLLSVTLTTSIACLTPVAAIAQAPLPGMTTLPAIQPSTGMGATSPLASGSTRPAGIPLGSTELATPGIAPAIPSQGMGTCAAPGNAGAPGALFDGGGLSSGSSLSCADSRIPASALPSPSAERAGIPLGATELGGAGLSPAVPTPGSNFQGNVGNTSGNP